MFFYSNDSKIIYYILTFASFFLYWSQIFKCYRYKSFSYELDEILEPDFSKMGDRKLKSKHRVTIEHWSEVKSAWDRHECIMFVFTDMVVFADVVKSAPPISKINNDNPFGSPWNSPRTSTNNVGNR